MTRRFCLSDNSRATFRVGFLSSWGKTSRKRKKKELIFDIGGGKGFFANSGDVLQMDFIPDSS